MALLCASIKPDSNTPETGESGFSSFLLETERHGTDESEFVVHDHIYYNSVNTETFFSVRLNQQSTQKHRLSASCLTSDPLLETPLRSLFQIISDF